VTQNVQITKRCSFNFFVSRKQVAQSKEAAAKEDIAIPSSIEEYCIKHKPIGSQSSDTNIDLCDDWYDDDDYDDDDNDDDGEYDCFDDNDDSGNADD